MGTAPISYVQKMMVNNNKIITLHHHILTRLTRSGQPHQDTSRLRLEPERLVSEALLGYVFEWYSPFTGLQNRSQKKSLGGHDIQCL